MEKRKNKLLEEAAMEIVEESKEKADQLLNSTSMRRMLKKVKRMQRLSEEDLKGILRKYYGTDFEFDCDFYLLNKFYVAKGDTEIIFDRIAKKMKTMNLQSMNLEESVVRRILCGVVVFHYRKTCHPEDGEVDELEIIKFQLSCDLQRAMYNLEKFIKRSMYPDCGCDNASPLIPRLYEIGQYMGKLEFIEMLEDPCSENEEAATKGTIN